MGVFVRESEQFTNTSVANNTHFHPHNQYCSNPHCRASSLSFCCVSNISDSVVLIEYPTRAEETYSDSDNANIQYQISFDTWQRERLGSLNSGLCLSVGWSGYSQIIRGTYTCEAVNTGLTEPQILNIGVFSIYGKKTNSLTCNELLILFQIHLCYLVLGTPT